MKKIILLIILFSVLISCKKHTFEEDAKIINQTNQSQTIIDSLDNEYEYSGTLPSNGNQNNVLVGTTWVLTKMVSGFATTYPNDTIEFINNTEYILNGGTKKEYRLSVIPSSTNYDLILYYFTPFGGSHYSGQVGRYFVDDGEISNVEFEDIQNTSKTIQAWFVKI